MSWWARSLVNSLRGGDDEAEEFEEEKAAATNEKSRLGSPSIAQEQGQIEEEEEDKEEGETPTRSVKDDISELTETLTRQFWGVASFLAPAPPGPDHGDLALAGQPGAADLPAAAADSPRIAGIRSDFAEIGGKFKSGISQVLSQSKAVTEISKFASSLLPFGSDEEELDEDEETDGVGVDAVGVNEEVLAFARNIAMHPETWLDFPLPHYEEDSDDFEMSDAQLKHASMVELHAPEFAVLKTELCPSQMSEEYFWKIYFVLLHSRLNRRDAELLSTPQIVEARARLLQDMHNRTKLKSKGLRIEVSHSKDDVTTIPIEENVMGPPDAVNVTSPSATLPCEEPASDSMKDIETEKHPVQTTEVKVVDKAVTEEEPASKNISSLTSKDATPMKYEDSDEWLEDDSGETSSARGVAIPLGQEEDVSFSDLEDVDDDQGPTQSSKTVPVDSQTTDSTGLVQPNKVSGGSAKGSNSTSPKS
ncbi:BSD domain containing protein [Musa troglodytarum]|uniref:BSD domain containing protein n=1 Tax=Musa troglodytarum TaxID=320322 RepID=A0A9E7JM88_9LILI|nr:BSD domain containing protein [Musa troglodytarum]